MLITSAIMKKINKNNNYKTKKNKTKQKRSFHLIHKIRKVNLFQVKTLIEVFGLEFA